MTRKHRVRRRVGARLLAAALAPLAMLAFAAPAIAGKPTGDYANFGECPLSHPELKVCLYAKSTTGQFTIGSTTVPLTKPAILQGGLAGEGPVYEFVAAAGGNTLPKAPETVPGGLFKIVAPGSWPGWLQAIFNEFVNKGLTGVTATTELVKTPASLNLTAALTGNGVALTLPVRVHLENPFLGGSCYVGSSSQPVNVNLTTGTTSPPPPNEPISGSPGTGESKDEGNLLILQNNSLVDNSFAAPEAQGCGGIFSFLVDPAVDAEIGLPSPAGHNTAILTGTQELAEPSAVAASEG